MCHKQQVQKNGNTGYTKWPVKVRSQIQIIEYIIDKTCQPEPEQNRYNNPAKAAIPVNMINKQIMKEDGIEHDFAGIAGRRLQIRREIENLFMYF